MCCFRSALGGRGSLVLVLLVVAAMAARRGGRGAGRGGRGSGRGRAAAEALAVAAEAPPAAPAEAAPAAATAEAAPAAAAAEAAPAAATAEAAPAAAAAEAAPADNDSVQALTSSASTLVVKPKQKPRKSVTPLEGKDDGMSTNNIAVHQKVQADFETLDKHPIFEGIAQADPYPIQAQTEGDICGCQVPMDPDEAKLALTETKHYKAAGNLFWANLQWSPQPHVPIRRSSIQQLKTHYFREPRNMPHEVVVAISKSEIDKLSQMKTTMKRISPEEIVYAMLAAAADAVRTGADNDTLTAWRTALLTTSFHWMVIDNEDDKFYTSQTLREHLITDCNTMKRTAQQWCFLVNGFKQNMEKKHGRTSNGRLAKLITENVDLAADTEELNETFILNCLKVHNVLFDHTAVLQMIQRCEEDCGAGAPFDSVQKLYLITTKTKEPRQLLWIFGAIYDLLRSKTLERGELSTRTIKGDGSHGKGLIDLLLLKLAFKNCLLNNTLDSLSLDLSVKIKIREVYADHEKYRLHCGYGEDGKDPDLTWQSGWKLTATVFCRLVEEIVYAQEHNQTLKAGLKTRKTPQELLTVGSIAELMDTLQEVNNAQIQAAKDKAAAEKAAAEEKTVAAGAKDKKKKDDDEDDDLEKVEQANKDEVMKYKRRCNRIVRAAVQLVPKPKTVTAMSKLIRESPASSVEDKDKVVINIYASALSGECVTNPSTRKPPLRQHYKDCIQAMLESRTDPRELHAQDIYVALDGGKHGAAALANQQQQQHELQ